jgi:biopolymer transport protein ExbB
MTNASWCLLPLRAIVRANFCKRLRRFMLEIVRAGGVLMLPIILCSVIAAAIILERLWTLQRKRVLPANLTAQVWEWARHDQLDPRHLESLRQNSPLGEVLAAGVAHRHAPREVIKERIEDTGRHVVHDLERYLNPLGTIAAISPLLGLLGTVFGMIKVFAAITEHGVGSPTMLAGGISEALITTAAGLVVAIPSLIGYRYLRGRIDGLVVAMEKETIKLLEALSPQYERALSGHETAEPVKRRA